MATSSLDALLAGAAGQGKTSAQSRLNTLLNRNSINEAQLRSQAILRGARRATLESLGMTVAASESSDTAASSGTGVTPREDSDTIVNAWRAVSNIDALLDEDLTPKAREAEDEEEEERQVMEEQKGQVQQLKTHFNAALQASLKIKDSYRTEGIRHSMSGRWESMTTPSGLPPLEESSGGPLPWESGYQSASGIGALGGPSSISLNRGMYGLRSTAATPHGPSPLSAVSSSANSASSSDGGAAPPTLRLPGASTNSRPNSGGAGPGGAAAPAAAAAAAAPFRPPPMALGSFVGSSAAGGGLAPPPLPGAGGKKPMGLQLAVGSQITHGEWTSQGQFNQKEKAETYIPPHLQQIRSDDLKKEKELGRGCFGSVYYALWKGVDVALKEFHHNAATDGPKVDIFAECESLASLRHPCIIAFYGIVVSPEALGTVLEYMRHGSLRSGLQKLAKQVKSFKGLRKVKAMIALQAARGMEYLHSQYIVHFDLKCDNLLCDLRDINRPVVKIGDLGLSKKKKDKFIAGNMRGTLPWMAPELFPSVDGGTVPEDRVTEKVDVFSFGVVLWEIWTLGQQPYNNMDLTDIFAGIMTNSMRPEMPDDIDPAWESLMKDCWHDNPRERPSFAEVAGRLDALVQRWGAVDPRVSFVQPYN